MIGYYYHSWKFSFSILPRNFGPLDHDEMSWGESQNKRGRLALSFVNLPFWSLLTINRWLSYLWFLSQSIVISPRKNVISYAKPDLDLIFLFLIPPIIKIHKHWLLLNIIIIVITYNDAKFSLSFPKTQISASAVKKWNFLNGFCKKHPFRASFLISALIYYWLWYTYRQ